MSQTIEILMIDDDIDNYHSYKNSAAKHGVLLRYSDNLEDGINSLRENYKLVAVILDGKGFIKREQKRGSDKEDFVHEALSELKLLETQQDRFLAKCVLTAWYDQLKDSLESRVVVFDKKKVTKDDASLAEMFNYLRSQVENSDSLKLRKKFKDVFSVTELEDFKTLLPALDTNLLKLLEKSETGRIVQQDFNSIRAVLESILIILSNREDKFIPKNLFHPDGRPNLGHCIRYLNGLQIIGKYPNILYPKEEKKRIPDPVASTFQFVNDMSSDLSHHTTDKFSKYGYISTVMGLCEILLWYKKTFAETK